MSYSYTGTANTVSEQFTMNVTNITAAVNATSVAGDVAVKIFLKAQSPGAEH
jgi:hypothetical protein